MSQEATYTVTFVLGKPPMITVRADSADEWKANLNCAESSGALSAIKAINDSLNGVRPAATLIHDEPSGATAAAVSPQPEPPAQELPASLTGNPKCGTCGADTKFEREGISAKSGRPYKRFSCTATQLHPATFI